MNSETFLRESVLGAYGTREADEPPANMYRKFSTSVLQRSLTLPVGHPSMALKCTMHRHTNEATA
ncbi:hypothetical protein PAXINDRAFT_20200 [Paxillus involutus ATCC 200175]|uniref:Uncharacterized protein n=1 Tax=Paxillus involutus ATCC 200175 TaxID=664439 RepID=A0A0C9TEN3_PAXIN|nr:hypothetical protein PAXINDRAFT_20200 [Paxillus involutus ATCC 200175]